jgi:hypothetical protein
MVIRGASLFNLRSKHDQILGIPSNDDGSIHVLEWWVFEEFLDKV